MKTKLPALAMLLALLALGGCATMPPAAPPASRPAAKPVPAAPAPAAQTLDQKPVAAAIDSTPSRDAQEVLATIPDPLAPGERVPALAPGERVPALAPGERVPAPVPSDSLTPATADSARAQIPVPAPTPVLGDRPTPVVEATPDSAAAAKPGTPPPATAAPSAPPPAATGPPPGLVPPDTCWRVQVSAPAERVRAERYLAASQSQLLVPMVIEKEKGLFKVRTRDCMDGAAADALRRRAVDTGFTGAFRFHWRKP